MEKPFGPMVVRFFMMQAHYRSTLDFTSEALLAAEKGYDKLTEAMKTIVNLKTTDESICPLKRIARPSPSNLD